MSSSYSDETVLSKLSSLNDTQDAIVTVAQWIMFHKRQAKRSVELWLQRLKESSSHRKLNLLYLANEIVQQSKVKNKPEFLNVFTPIIVDGTDLAYRGTDQNVQAKIKRVIQVWRERNIFKPDIQAAIEQRIDAVDKDKSGPGRGGLKLGGMLGGSLGGGSSVPLEFVPLMKTHKELGEKVSSSTIAVGAANSDFTKQFDADNLPAPPVYAARLSALMKTLDTAQSAVKGAMDAREAHIRNLERLLEQARVSLDKDRVALADLRSKRDETEKTKNDVEQMILEEFEKDDPANINHNNNNNISSGGGGTNAGNGTGAGNALGNGNGTANDSSAPAPDDIKSPDVEALTPPHQVTFEPDAPPSASVLHHQHSVAPAPQPEPAFHHGASELLASLSGPLSNGGAAGRLKRPQADEGEVFEGIDADLVKMFQNEQQLQQQQQQQLQQRADPKRQRLMQEDDGEYHP